MTTLDEAAYKIWSQEFKEASTSLEQREEKLKSVAEKVEKNLRLLGVTAIEDKLQEVRNMNMKII
jgi:magnesium-transporting ATPase (P-type)